MTEKVEMTRRDFLGAIKSACGFAATVLVAAKLATFNKSLGKKEKYHLYAEVYDGQKCTRYFDGKLVECGEYGAKVLSLHPIAYWPMPHPIAALPPFDGVSDSVEIYSTTPK